MNWMNEGGGPEWKHGWSGQTLASISTPSIHLLTIFVIVIFLLSYSGSADYKADTRTSTSLFFMLLLIIAAFVVAYFLQHGGLNFHFPAFPQLRPRQHQIIHRPRTAHFSSFTH